MTTQRTRFLSNFRETLALPRIAHDTGSEHRHSVEPVDSVVSDKNHHRHSVNRGGQQTFQRSSGGYRPSPIKASELSIRMPIPAEIAAIKCDDEGETQ